MRPGQAYVGPQLSLETENGMHMVVMQAPSAGWSVSVDRSRQTAGPTEVLVTVRRPDPAFVYAQVIVDQRVLTRIDESQPIELFARVLDHRGGSGRPYDRVVLTPIEP